MLEGLLVDLVPFGTRFEEQEHQWENGPAAFWGDMGDRQFLSHAKIKQRQDGRHEEPTENSTGVLLGIQTKDQTPIGLMAIGWIAFHHRTGVLGAMIGDPNYWSGGYGTDALLLLVDYAFDWLDLRRLWLVTMAPNARVIRQMEKVGFTLECQIRQGTLVDGVYHDVLLYGLLREEWPGRTAMIERLGLHAKP
jgi:RimJ/RimL family protein N-acetyltransferase